MTSDCESAEAGFDNCLKRAVKTVRQSTRIGVSEIAADLSEIGGVAAAKRRLVGSSMRTSGLAKLVGAHQGRYLYACKRIGRLDLSVEATALDPRFAGLFTREELDTAGARLIESGFDPALEGMGRAEVIPESRSRLLTPAMRGGVSRTGILFFSATPCDAVSECSHALNREGSVHAEPELRRHLIECLQCRASFPELVSAFEHFDAVTLWAWQEMVPMFQKISDLSDESLERFLFLRRDDYDDPEDADLQVSTALEFILPVCAWRAVKLGCHLGRLMEGFARTFDERGDIWLKWRTGDGISSISSKVGKMDDEAFRCALTARNLLFIRRWPREEEDVLWLPSDRDIHPIPGCLQVEEADFDDWEEILGKPPDDLNPAGVLYLAEQAAFGEFPRADRSSFSGIPPAIKEQLDRIESGVSASRNEQAESAAALISHAERTVAHMVSADRFACEQSILNEIPGYVYEKLVPQARCLLLGAEQIYRMQDFVAPGQTIANLACAFEVQVRSAILPGLFEYLKDKRVPKVMPPPNKRGTEPLRPLWKRNSKPDEFALGDIGLLLQVSEPAVDEFLAMLHLDAGEIREAVEVIRDPRNKVVHGKQQYDRGTAAAMRKDWLHWGSRPGGIYSVLVPVED